MLDLQTLNELTEMLSDLHIATIKLQMKTSKLDATKEIVDVINHTTIRTVLYVSSFPKYNISFDFFNQVSIDVTCQNTIRSHTKKNICSVY